MKRFRVTINTETYTHSDLQGPGGVVSKDLLFCDGDSEGTKVLAATVWPVLLTLLLVAFLQVGYHDNGGRFLLIYQPPEVNKHVLFGTYKRVHCASVFVEDYATLIP